MGRIILAAIMLTSLIACDSDHTDHTFTYREQAYTTSNVSEFEVSHYKTFGNNNVLILEGNNERSETKRKKGISTLCKDYSMECKTINVSNFNEATLNEISEAHRFYNGKTYLVMTEDADMTGLFIASLEFFVFKGTEANLDTIFKQIGVKDGEKIKDKLSTYKN